DAECARAAATSVTPSPRAATRRLERRRKSLIEGQEAVGAHLGSRSLALVQQASSNLPGINAAGDLCGLCGFFYLLFLTLGSRSSLFSGESRVSGAVNLRRGFRAFRA